MSKRENPFRPRRPLVPSEAARARRPERTALDAREVETEDRRVEVTIAWGETTILHVAHLEIGAPFTLGEDEGSASFVVGREALGMSTLPLVTFDEARARIAVPAGASITRAPEVRGGSHGADSSPREWGQVPLEPGVTYRVRHRAFVFTLREVNAGKRVKRARPFDWAFVGHIMAVGLLFAALVLLSSLTPRTAGALSPPALDATNRYVRHAIMKAEQRDAAASPIPHVSEERARAEPASPIERARRQALHRPPRSSDRGGGELGREGWRERASSGSVAASLRAIAAELPGSPGWVMNDSIGDEAWAQTPGAPGGFGELDVIGAPRVSDDATGAIGVKFDRIGPPPGEAPRTRLSARTTEVPPPAPRVEMDARGGLEREIVRRVVRRNEAKVRFCYEQALQGDPDLAGRVELKFLISPSGAVQSASVLRTQVGHEVGECIARAVRRMSFPAPEGGIVAVSYSWTFRAR